MAIYAYRAINPMASAVSGTIAADTPRQARDILRERGLIVRDVAAHKSAARQVRTTGLKAAMPRQSIFTFSPKRPRARTRHHTTRLIRELSTLLAVGIPLLEALQTLARQHNGKFQAGILLLKDRIAAGSSLAGAMAAQPHYFDELCVNITEVGEDAGTLDVSLERLAGFRERYEQLRNRLGTALLYPAIVTIVAVFASLFQMTFVVPRILQPLVEQGLPLPLPTRIVKGASDWVLDWWWVLLIVVAGAATASTVILRSERGRRAFHRLLLRLPILGDLVRKQAMVHVCVVMSTLLRGGIVFVRALQISQRTAGNLVLRDALRRCEVAVSAGADIGAAMEQTAVFPPMVAQVFSLGQQSGRLEEMLDRLAVAYDQEVSTAAARLAAIVEPVLIVTLALLVLLIVMATVMPILEAGNAIQ